MDVEMYVGYDDRTWETMLVEIPDDTPEDQIEKFAQDELDKLLRDADVGVAFTGIYLMMEPE